MDEDAVLQQLRTLLGSRRKVHLTRELPADPNVNGFVVGVGQQWVLVQAFHDFSPMGYTALRVRDITEIRSGEYERHWERMLAGEGLLEQIGVTSDLPLDELPDLLRVLQQRGQNVIVECQEKGLDLDDFYIGEILSVDERSVCFANFDGLGQWDEFPNDIPFDEITTVQFETPYVLTFSKYLDCRPNWAKKR